MSDPTISDGPTMVNVPGPHPGAPGLQIAKGAQVTNPDYFDNLLTQSSVNLDSKQGDAVSASAMDIIEFLTVQNSSRVWIFDDALEVGFGNKALKWNESLEGVDVSSVQTRSGAGSALAGFLANRVSPNGQGAANKTVTVLATATTLPLLLPVLKDLPFDSSSKVVVHLATTKVDKETLNFTNALDTVVPLLPSIDTEKFAIVFSSTPRDIIHSTASAYSPHSSKNVINIIESTFAGRQVTNLEIPKLPTVYPVPAFTPVGPINNATSVFLAVAGHISNQLIASDLVKEDGASAVVVLHAWDDIKGLAKVVSGGQKKLYLINESSDSQAVLREVVLSALYDPHGSSSRSVFPSIKSIVVPAGSDVLRSIESLKLGVPASPTKVDAAKTITFFTSPTEPLPELLTQLFTASQFLSAALDRFGSSVPQGVKSVLNLSFSSKDKLQPPVHSVGQVNGEHSDLVWVSDPQIIKQSNVLDGLKPNGLFVVVAPWSEEEVASKLDVAERKLIQEKNIRVFILPPTDSPIVQEIAFLMLYSSAKKLSSGIKEVLAAYYEDNVPREALEEAQANLTEVGGISEWSIEPEEGKSVEAEKPVWQWDALHGRDGIVDTGSEGRPIKGDWSLAAKQFLFKEAFEYGPEIERDEELKEKAILDLRPSLEDKTYLVTVSENRRLTPETYDRNVFHIAFDTKGTGLKYEVGEALGVHGWNDETEVQEFLQWYGLDPEELVSVPSPHDNGATYETRTVFQLLQQNLDLFGKPGKSFYASLAQLATDRNEQRTLLFIAAPEGAALFKKMSEVETVTFADVLKQFKSARPSIEELVGLVPEIKPRHYSIASSNAAVGDSVELLIVTVDWATPSGTPRYGQCTRYLAGLAVGSKVTVSIKPSVMKLPPLDSQPIIMAGLGTG